jgi:hypothetical protein
VHRLRAGGMSATEHFFSVVRQLSSRQHSENLTQVDFYASNIGNAGAIRLADSLACNITLKNLNIGSNCISDEGATAVAKALEHNTTLHTLSIRENFIGNESAVCFAEALTCFDVRLQVLDLSSNDINDQGAIALAQIYKKLSNSDRKCSLSTLYLSNNRIGNAAAVEFSKCLLQNETLMLLDLSYCRIADSGGLSFAEALPLNSHLQTLNLSHNRLSRALGERFESALASRSETLELLVDGQGIDLDAIIRIESFGPKVHLFHSVRVHPGPQVDPEMHPVGTAEKLSSVCVKPQLRCGGSSRKGGSLVHVIPPTKKPSQRSKASISRGGGCNPKPTSLSSFKWSGSNTADCKHSLADADMTSKLKSDSSAISASDSSSETDRFVSNIPHPHSVIEEAELRATSILCDAQAAAAEIIMQAQNHLNAVLCAAPTGENSQQLESSARPDTGVSTATNRSRADTSISTYDCRFDNSLILTKSSLSSDCSLSQRVPFTSYVPPEPLGFQRCMLVKTAERCKVALGNDNWSVDRSESIEPLDGETSLSIFSASHIKTTASDSEQAETAASSNLPIPLDASREQIDETAAALSAPASSHNLSREHVDILKTFLTFKSGCLPVPLVHDTIKLFRLCDLPSLQLQHLSELCYTDEVLSIDKNETTGPLWFIKFREICKNDDDLDGLPEFISVKQFFEEIRDNFESEFPVFHAIQAECCVSVTHVLFDHSKPVGLVSEHFPHLLYDVMHLFSLADAVCILSKCATALHSLHVSGIVHSNISASSFLLSKDYHTVKFAEFYIDQSLLSSIGFVHKQDPLFAAPEITDRNSSPSISSDIYAFGMLIWRTLHPLPVSHLCTSPIVSSLAAARGFTPAFSRSGIPASIISTCHKCMSVDPRVRPQSMKEVADAVHAAHSAIVFKTM